MALNPTGAASAAGAGQAPDDEPKVVDVPIEDADLDVEIEEDGLFDTAAEAENLDRNYTDAAPPAAAPDPKLDTLEVEDDDEPAAQPNAQAAEVDDDVDLDPEDQEYGKKVQKRIAKMTKRLRREEAARQHAESQLQIQQAQIQQLHAQNQYAVASQLDTAIAAARTEVEGMTAELETALEIGDSARQAQLQADIAKRQAELQYAEMRRPELGPSQQQMQQQQPQPQQQRQQMPPQGQPDARTQAWINTNAAWFDNPNYYAARVQALQIAQSMIGEGVPYDDNYFTELESRLSKEMPKMSDFFDLDDPGPASAKPARRQPSSPVAAADNPAGGQKPTQRTNRVRIDANDRARMEAWGLDPTDKNQLMEFAVAKRGAALDHPDG